MGFEESKRAIAQIRQVNSECIIGTGVLVAEEYLLTCAHVVREALLAPEQIIGDFLAVEFFNTADTRQAEVIFYDYDPLNYGRDVAVLYLPSMVQVGTVAAPLVPLRRFHGAELRVFGYPGNDSAGRNLTAITNGEVDGGWVQIEDTKVTGLAVEAGFSGSPVWSEADQATVGMVVARHNGQDDAKVGFIIPVQKLQSALQAINQHALATLLLPHQSQFAEQITTAYQVCRPKTWSQPVEISLQARLADMALMSEKKLLEFAACLCNQAGTDAIKADLIAWIERYKPSELTVSDFIIQMQRLQEQRAPQLAKTVNPCLLIQVQADKTTKQEPYQVKAWFVRDSRLRQKSTSEGYDYKTGEGAEPLTPKDLRKYIDGSNNIDIAAGVKYEDIPVLMADYVDQIANRDVPLQELTIEFFLPLSLINQAIEQCCIPAEFGFPVPLGIDEDGAHVVLRSQERLEFARGRKPWQEKWEKLQHALKKAAIEVFLCGDQYSGRELSKELKQALALKLTGRLPKASNQGDIGLMLATGTPAALWLRCHTEELANRLDTDVLDEFLERVPDKVCNLRRGTPVLDEDADSNDSPELGHHLSFLWEDFYRVPPIITYSDSQL